MSPGKEISCHYCLFWFVGSYRDNAEAFLEIYDTRRPPALGHGGGWNYCVALMLIETGRDKLSC